MPKSQDIAVAPYLDQNGYIVKPTMPSGHSYAAYRDAVDIPPVYRAWMAILEAIRSFEYFIKVANNDEAERWINDAIGRIYHKTITGAAESVLMGFQVAEIWFERGEDGLYWPQVPIFPYPDYINVKVDKGHYKGFKQSSTAFTWLVNTGDISVTADESILWTYGPAIHGNPYGRGLMRSVYDYATAFVEVLNNAKTSTERQNYPLILAGVYKAQYADSDIDAFCNAIAEKIRDYGVMAFGKSSQDDQIELKTIQPTQSAVPDAVGLASDYVRYIAMGMLASLKTFHNAADDAGSYALSEVQLASFDRIITGIYETLKPGIETLIRRTLRYNFGDVDFELDVERVDELTLARAAKTFDEMINNGYVEAVEMIDVKRLADMAGKPVKGEALETSTKQAEVEKLAKLPPEQLETTRVIRREFADYYDDRVDELAQEIRKNPTRARSIARREVASAINKAKQYYQQVYQLDPPALSEELNDQWELHGANLARQYRNVIANNEINDAERAARGMEPNEQANANAALKLADRALKSAIKYFGDLNAARGENA